MPTRGVKVDVNTELDWMRTVSTAPTCSWPWYLSECMVHFGYVDSPKCCSSHKGNLLLSFRILGWALDAQFGLFGLISEKYSGIIMRGLNVKCKSPLSKELRILTMKSNEKQRINRDITTRIVPATASLISTKLNKYLQGTESPGLSSPEWQSSLRRVQFWQPPNAHSDRTWESVWEEKENILL